MRWIIYEPPYGTIVSHGESERLPGNIPGYEVLEVTNTVPLDSYVSLGVILPREEVALEAVATTVGEEVDIELPEFAKWRCGDLEGTGDFTATFGEPGAYSVILHGRYKGAATIHVESLDVAKEAAWARIKARRVKELLVTQTPFGPFDTDDDGRSNIMGKVLDLQLGGDSSASVTWKMADNSYAVLPQEDFFLAARSITPTREQTYATSWALEALIQNASTKAELDAIQWP